MSNKNYTISIDCALMESFQKKCRAENTKYSVRIKDFIEADMAGQSAAPDRIDLLLSKVMATLDEVKEVQDARKTVDIEIKKGDEF